MTATLCLPNHTYHPIMWWVRTTVEPQIEILTLKVSALEDNAARAGFALACCYANSNEYEAELIAARRKAGVYGQGRNPWIARIAAIAAGLLALVALIVLIT
jgi:hypothetical protein